MGSLGTALAAWRYSVAVAASGDLSSRNGNIQEKPMKELDTRNGSRNFAALLVYVIGTAEYIHVMADEDERFGGLGDVFPLELGIAVLAEREEMDRIDPSEGELGGYWTPVLKALAIKLHGEFFPFVISPLRRAHSDENLAALSV